MATSTNKPGDNANEKKEFIKYDPEEYKLRKLLPRCFAKRPIDVFVNTKTDHIAQLKRCEKLLDSGEAEIYIHGLGLAVNRAVNIALKLQANFVDSLILSTNISTVDLVDDFEPQTDDGDYHSRSRSNSAIHIKITRCVPVVNLSIVSP